MHYVIKGKKVRILSYDQILRFGNACRNRMEDEGKLFQFEYFCKTTITVQEDNSLLIVGEKDMVELQPQQNYCFETEETYSNQELGQ